MAAVQRNGDANTGGGIISSTAQTVPIAPSSHATELTSSLSATSGITSS